MDDTDRRTESADGRQERAETLRALGRRADTESAGRRRAVDKAVAVFGGERQLLLAVHRQWQVNLLARLDQVLESGADDPHDAVFRAVEELSRALPGFAALLSEHADDPVLDRARLRLSDYVNQACPCGRPHPLVARPVRTRSAAGCAVRHIRAMAAWGHRPRLGGGLVLRRI